MKEEFLGIKLEVMFLSKYQSKKLNRKERQEYLSVKVLYWKSIGVGNRHFGGLWDSFVFPLYRLFVRPASQPNGRPANQKWMPKRGAKKDPNGAQKWYQK